VKNGANLKGSFRVLTETPDFRILGRSEDAVASDAAREELLSEEGGLLAIDKPYGETSFFVVNRIRGAISRATGIRRIKCGHAGTLDPLATGLLLLATRRSTKKIPMLMGLGKTYRVRMRFGVTSPSFDLERPIEICDAPRDLNDAELRHAILALQGEHNQEPPAFSAIKQKGKPVYRRARAGEEVTLQPRAILVHEVEILSTQWPEAAFRVCVSKGTYIRSIVRDLAASLGTGGILTDLVRESIGPYKNEDALTLTDAIRLLAPSETPVATHP